MTREEAINEIKTWDFLNEKESEAVRTLIPELRESEDERIRKAIVHLLDVASEAYLVGETGFKKEQFLSYLEKQKELTPADGWDYADKRMSHPLYLEGFEAGRAVERELSEFEKQKEQKPAEWSEEDEKKIHFLSRLIEFQVRDGEYCFGEGSCMISKQEAIEMLKSLRPSWKPSEEQINSAIYAVGFLGFDSEYRKYLESLISDLQKLTEK